MKSRSTLTLLLTLPFFYSCTLFYTAAGAYKKPQRETPASIKEHIGGKNYDGLYIIKNDSTLKFFIDSIGSSVPNVMIFNKAHQNIYQSKTCVWANVNQIDSIHSSGAWNVKEGYRFENIQNSVSLIDGVKPDTNHEFIIYYVWAKFSPKLSKKLLASIEKDYKAKKMDVYIGNINVDLQK